MDDVIRVGTDEHAAAIATLYAPIVRETFISFEETPPSAEEIARRIAETLPAHPWLVLESRGAVAGWAYASRFRARAAYAWTAETTIYLAPAAQGAGRGRRLYGALLEVLRLQGFARAMGGIALPNERSVRLHEALGFVPAGVWRRVGFKHGAWRDVGLWQHDLGEGSAPRPPVPFADLDPSALQRALG